MSAARVCGTGGGGGFNPKPGDPDNNIFITATPAFGGVDIGLVYPETNPHAVAFVNLYRSTNSSPTTAIYHHKMVGSYFFDRNTAATAVTYYYWAEMVTVSGTVMPKVGPASAVPRPMIEELIEQLTGRIDQGLLATSLKDDVALIQTNKLGLDAETLARAATDDSLAASLAETRAISEDTQALVQQEVLARAEADSALVDSVNTLAVTVGQDIQAAIQQEQQLRASADQALANQINTAQAKLGSDIASVQTTLGADIQKIGGDLVSIGALYTAKVTVNGLIGGFGVYNDGEEVEAGFDVDRFWIGRTGTNKRKPFIIQNGEVFIDEAVINRLVFSKLRADNGSLIVEDGKVKAEYILADWANIRNVEVGTADIRNAAITQAKLGTASVTNAKIADAAITRAKIANLSVDTLKIANNAVTVPESYYAAGQLTNTGWITAARVSGYNPGGGITLVTMAFRYALATSRTTNTEIAWASVSVSARLVVGGAVVRDFGVVAADRAITSGGGHDGGPYTASASISGTAMLAHTMPRGSGAQTVELQVSLVGRSRSCSQRYMLLLGVKK